MRQLISLCIGAAILGTLLSFQYAIAQTSSGQISGIVTDPSRAPIAGATVTLANELNAGVRTTVTNQTGSFVFASVTPGTYDLSIMNQGFKTFSKQHIVLNASDQLSAGILEMEIGAASQSIVVQADITQVQTESGERSALIDEKQMATLLTPNRDFLNFTRV
jgi:hypothetical protein